MIRAARLLFQVMLVGLIAGSSGLSAAELHIYEHNGSVIEWAVVGDRISATYSTPRPGIETAGVEPGTVLFRGTYDAGRIVGRAYAFKAGCPAASYEVIGEDFGKRIVLRGPAPHRAPNSCAVVSYSARSPHAELVLIYSATHH